MRPNQKSFSCLKATFILTHLTRFIQIFHQTLSVAVRRSSCNPCRLLVRSRLLFSACTGVVGFLVPRLTELLGLKSLPLTTTIAVANPWPPPSTAWLPSRFSHSVKQPPSLVRYFSPASIIPTTPLSKIPLAPLKPQSTMPLASVDTRGEMSADPDFKPPSTLYDMLSAFSSPSGSMNYSPKHSRKPLSLLSSRNINMKNLLLNLSPSTNSSTTLPPRRGKPLALAIPLGLLPTVDQLPHHSHNGMSTPLNLTHTTSFEAPVGRFMHLLPTSMSDMSQDQLPDRLDMLVRSLMLQSPFGSSGQSASALKDNLEVNFGLLDLMAPPNPPYGAVHSLGYETGGLGARTANTAPAAHQIRNDTTNGHLIVPEELQEQSNLHAYVNGPANVLNSILFLYLDPLLSEKCVDINNYDLVINVAKECRDLSGEFDVSGGKQYVYIPWSHTLSILEKLPELTSTIAKYDTQGKKILVHCQCGVLRSACVIVAYFMVKFKISVNEAYELLKSGTDNTAETCNLNIANLGNTVQACDRICPNMSLIFELMDFGERLASKTSEN